MKYVRSSPLISSAVGKVIDTIKSSLVVTAKSETVGTSLKTLKIT